MYREFGAGTPPPVNAEADVGSCSESCELYETEVIPPDALPRKL